VSTSGTCAVSETGERAAAEDDPAPIGIIGQWPYYRAKLFAERAALERSGGDIEVLSVNPSLVLGPGDVNGSSTDDVRRIIEGSVPFVPVGGVSFVDVRDTADALVRAMERGRAGERYLLGACNLTLRASPAWSRRGSRCRDHARSRASVHRWSSASRRAWASRRLPT
jgi:dihydroflavonol-4-reductase